MITAILMDQRGQSHIRRYQTDNPREARNKFVDEWIARTIVWEDFEFYGPNCSVENPAFTPDFLRQNGYEDEPAPVVENGVTIYEWFCATGPHGSDEHIVTGYFVPSKNALVSELAKDIKRSREIGVNSPNEALVNDHILLMRLCSRMKHALTLQNERRAYGFMEAARCLAAAVPSSEDFEAADLRRLETIIEADMQNGLWEYAIRDADNFTNSIRGAIQKTAKRN